MTYRGASCPSGSLLALSLFLSGTLPGIAFPTSAELVTAQGSAVMLPPPEALYATNGELRSIPLQWEPVLSNAVVGYAVQREGANDGEFLVLTQLEGRNQTHYVDDDELEDGGRYRYRVCTYDAMKRISTVCSPVVEADTAPAPSPPPGVQAYSRLPRQVFLRWRPSTSNKAAKYAIERSPSQGGPFERIATLDGRFTTSYLDGDLGNLRVFYYRVISINRLGGEGPPSKVERGVTKPEPLPPIGLQIAKQELGANHLVWGSNVESDIAGYRLYRQYEGEAEAQLITTLAADLSTVTDWGVPSHAEVTYSMVAFDLDGLESAPSSVLSFTTLGYELEAQVVGDHVQLQWNARPEEGFTGARVYRSGRVSRTGAKELAQITSTDSTFTDETAPPGKTHYYHVVLERFAGRSAPPSRPLSVDVPAPKNP